MNGGLDFVSDCVSTAKVIRMLTMVDDGTRECQCSAERLMKRGNQKLGDFDVNSFPKTGFAPHSRIQGQVSDRRNGFAQTVQMIVSQSLLLPCMARSKTG
jgi:hypothetical protein